MQLAVFASVCLLATCCVNLPICLPVRREVVRWLKGWDPCVFGTAAPAQLAQQARGFGSRFQRPQHRQQQEQQQQQQFGAGGGGGQADPLGRPEHKIILIAGPPGLCVPVCLAACLPAVAASLCQRPRLLQPSAAGVGLGVSRSAAPHTPLNSPLLLLRLRLLRPAGLGKTTLAHVCAAHCGYRPVEINASDDRSGGCLQAKVLDAVEMQVGGRVCGWVGV